MSKRPGALIEKDPSSVEPQGFDWTDYLAELDDDETVSTSSWSVTPSGLTLSDDAIVPGGLRTKVVLSGGAVRTKYTVTNHIMTSSGVEDDRSFSVLVQER